jgi:hypothetical protein
MIHVSLSSSLDLKLPVVSNQRVLKLMVRDFGVT